MFSVTQIQNLLFLSVFVTMVLSTALSYRFLFKCCLCFVVIGATMGLRYDYGDGTYYIGNVAEDGKPSGRGQFFNSSGALGKNVKTVNQQNVK